MPARHELKCWPVYYREVSLGNKHFELRRYDRNFQVGDTLCLREYDHDTKSYTGEYVDALVTHILHGGVFGLQDGFCCMSIEVERYGILKADHD